MAEISKLFVTIGSKFDPKGLNKGLTGMNKFKAAAAKVTKILAATALAGVAMGTALFAAGLKVAKIAGVQEQAEIKLAQAMKSAGGFTEEALQSNLEYASSLQKITTVGDETSIEIMQLGLNMGVAADQIKEATKESIALSKAYGVDLKASMKMVALARAGEFSMLARYIPQLRTTTDKVEQLAIFNKAMADGFKIAEAETKTYAGMVEQLKNDFGDLMEKIGFKVIPILKELMKAIKDDILPIFDDWLDGLGDTETAAEKVGDALKTITSNLSDYIEKIKLAIIGARAWSEFNTLAFKKGIQSVKEFLAAYKASNRKIKTDNEDLKDNVELTEEEKTRLREEAIAKAIKAEQLRLKLFLAGLEKEKQEARKALAERWVAVQGFVSQVSSTFDSFFDLQSVQIQNEMNEDIAAAKKRHDAKLTSEEEYRAEVDNIRDEAAIAEKKRREALKPIMIAQAIANTAQGVTKALAALGPFGFIPAALIAAAGAAEVATIQAQKFGEGVRNFAGGLGIVGDKGPELMEIPRGANIYNNAETKNMLGGNINNYITIEQVTNRSQAREQAELIGDEITKKIGRARKL